ncbi:hypothetical protein M1466_02300 [Candidatus Dependentiae bacterium]|nr:hypothetical protein [Candidatus Dependentiae bacterium]
MLKAEIMLVVSSLGLVAMLTAGVEPTIESDTAYDDSQRPSWIIDTPYGLAFTDDE